LENDLLNNELVAQVFAAPLANFNKIALQIFALQYANNLIYKQYCDCLNKNPANVSSVEHIPFLPIQFFKSHKVVTGNFKNELYFESSGTTQTINSKHFVKHAHIYEQSFMSAFSKFYGAPQQYCFLGLLPNYLQKGKSSLVYMVQQLIKQSQYKQSGFYLNELDRLYNTLLKNETEGIKTILFGTTFALLDFADLFKIKLTHTTIIETGGMKGRRKELTRNEVHEQLASAFATININSEYGMTELLSQAYANNTNLFACPNTIKVFIREQDDPFNTLRPTQKKPAVGCLNIIDLANIFSCSFIATDDIGKLYFDGLFEIMGRLDNSDLRGCSLLTV
jgi:hypothetical protein